MNKDPQEILIKVMCSERLPSKVSQFYFVELERGEKHHCLFSTYRKFITPYHYYDVIAWYEPATRVVLTVEEWETLQNKINLLAADNGRLMAKHYNP